MFHIVVGFETHRKDSPSESLYTGHDPEAVKAAVDANLSRFGVIRVYKNPAWSKRYNRGDAPEAPAEEATAPETPSEEATAPEAPSEEATAPETPAEEATAPAEETGRRSRK